MTRYGKKLASEYVDLFETAQVLPSKLPLVEEVVAKAVANRSRYEAVLSVGIFTGMPWFFIAAIHNLESSFDFTKHLHNGDPLTGRTVQVPAGRPKIGSPPFKWEASAMDALTLRELDKVSSWTLPELMWRLEGYNGLGYRDHHPNVLSPYLWSFTQHYKRGKYIKDGPEGWDPNAVSGQVGAATLIRRMLESGVISTHEINMTLPVQELPTIRYSEKDKIPYGDFVQIHLNQFPGIKLKVDQWPGPKTSAAFCSVYGRFLFGDPREKDSQALEDATIQVFPGLPVQYNPNSGCQYGTLVQTYLNRFPNQWVSVDSWLGNRSSEAFSNIHGMYLLGDPRKP